MLLLVVVIVGTASKKKRQSQHSYCRSHYSNMAKEQTAVLSFEALFGFITSRYYFISLKLWYHVNQHAKLVAIVVSGALLDFCKYYYSCSSDNECNYSGSTGIKRMYTLKIIVHD